MSGPRFRTLSHRADLRVAVWGDDEEELIGNAVAAALTLALGARPRLSGATWVKIRVWPDDLSSRLVRAVNEALFELYTRRRGAIAFQLTASGARLALAPLPEGCRPELEVKAATYHDLKPRRSGGRLAALMTLDV